MTDADIAVIGGGVIGCLIAREITTRAPQSRVAVIDRDVVACGATRRSAGLHFPRGTTPRVREMADLSQTSYEELLGDEPSLPIHPLALSVLSSNAAGVERTYLGRAGLTPAQDVHGGLITVPRGTSVWTGRGCHYADVGALTEALARHLRPRVAFREGTRVTAVEPGSAAVTLRLSTGESFSASKAVLAPGPWLADPAWRSLVEPLGARVKKVIALHVDGVPEAHAGAVVFEDEDAFLLPLHHRGHWLFSYTCQEWDVEPDDIAEGISAAHLAEARACLERYAPGLAARATSGRVFCDAYSPTREPLVRALDDSARVVFAGAANGSGYRLAPAIAAETADLLRILPGQRKSA
ncbi:glycine/D-amino acid oxidase-like deaminating enzyme [Streptomyces sp. BK022]|uniref:NAD(P)/FAD-dependent oxidoreductase n=1 Tax=Streptomyces sp. BK022 TaxID=2512123 RepID=UPI001029C4DC|nr:FAD-binding oxidoreductase [Streptomyces sp. BK022]RZU44121.1 glycine/D-amino acid oxidase-like deaminating enzyme [Streptomyces sp. BK022]